jgi:hypothetical protein
MGYASRRRAAEVAERPAPRMIFGLTRRQKEVSFKLSYAMAMVDSLKSEEEKLSGGKTGALYVKLANLEEHLGAVLDEYRIAKFHRSDLEKAAELFDVLDAKIREIFP